MALVHDILPLESSFKLPQLDFPHLVRGFPLRVQDHAPKVVVDNLIALHVHGLMKCVIHVVFDVHWLRENVSVKYPNLFPQEIHINQPKHKSGAERHPNKEDEDDSVDEGFIH